MIGEDITAIGVLCKIWRVTETFDNISGELDRGYATEEEYVKVIFYETERGYAQTKTGLVPINTYKMYSNPEDNIKRNDKLEMRGMNFIVDNTTPHWFGPNDFYYGHILKKVDQDNGN